MAPDLVQVQELRHFKLSLLILFSTISFAVHALNGDANEVIKATFGSKNPISLVLQCDNVTNGGKISGDEIGCPAPNWDPVLIANVSAPAGGTGALEYVWIYTTGDPLLPLTMWIPIPNSNSASLDPAPISQTTYYKRFSRRVGCTDYTGESNAVKKESACCVNVNGGGLVGHNQTSCIVPFDPGELVSIYLPAGGIGNLTYQWVSSETGSAYSPSNSDWKPIAGANAASYDPGPIEKSTWFIRLAKRHACSEYEGVSNMVKVSLESPVRITSLDPKGVTCNGGADGAITLTYSGALFPVNFSWSPNIGNIKDPTNLKAGTYHVTLTDAMGCAATASTTVMDGVKLAVGLSGTTESCLGAKDGSANVSWVTGGQPGYTYLWSVGGQKTPAITNLGPGNFTLTVTDTKGCTGTGNLDLADGKPLDIALELKDETCLGANNGSAKILSVAGGTPAYSYTWSNSLIGSTSSALNLIPGNYSVSVTDGRGCRGNKNFSLNNGPPLDIATSVSNVSCQGGKNGFATIVSVNGGTQPFSYSWNDPVFQQSATAINLSAGSYKVTVRDAIGCRGVGNVSVSEPSQLAVSISPASPLCSYTSDGTAAAVVIGGTAPYSYKWSDVNSQKTAKALALVPGSYSVTVTDAKGCSASSSTSIQATPAIQLSTVSTEASCFGIADGTAKVNVLNGDPALHTYSWGGVLLSSNQNVVALTAGTYKVTVTNQSGCTAIAQAAIGSPTELKVSLSAQKASCFGNSDGEAIAVASGGTPKEANKYDYMWNAPGNPTGPQLGNVTPGQYVVTVSDARGCKANASIDIGSPSAISIDMTATPVTCNGKSDGKAMASIQGGVAPYKYSWDDSAGSKGMELSGLSAGNYTITVTDANGCSQSGVARIEEPLALALTINKTELLCASDNNGSLNTRVIGGVLSYRYAWSTGATTSSLTGLKAGGYSLTVTDASGCIIQSSSQIEYSSDLSSAVNSDMPGCFGGSDGKATVMATGGAGPYLYQWSNGVQTAVAMGLTAGSYTVTVTDSKGCFVQNTVTVESPKAISCEITLTKPVSTFGGSDAEAMASATGGLLGTVSYRWSNGGMNKSSAGLNQGVHSVTITDEKNCSCIAQINVKNPSKLGDFVWNDLNQNGVQEQGEPGLAGVAVKLLGTTNSGVSINKTTHSSAAGLYYFDGLQPGNYRLEFSLPSNSFFSPKNAADREKDSDVNPYSGSTEIFGLQEGVYESNWDAGIIVLDELTNIGDLVWHDGNRNGIQDAGEKGVEGVVVDLFGLPSGQKVASVVTEKSGHYLFKDITQGSYFIEFKPSSLPQGFVFTLKNQGPEWARDSDANPSNGRTEPFEVAPYTLDNLTFDAGIYELCQNLSSGGQIGQNENFCGLSAVPSKITSISLPAGGTGEIQYQWLKSNNPAFKGLGDAEWSMISNSNQPELAPGAIAESTFFIRLARRSGCLAYAVQSNVVSKSLSAFPVAQISGLAAEHCLNVEANLEAVNAGSGSSYSWSFGENATPLKGDKREVAAVAWSSEGFKNISLSVTRFGCTQTTQQTIRVKACEAPLQFDGLQAKVLGDKVQLTWSVKGDKGNVIYFVQRSEDGVNFENLGAFSIAQMDSDGSFRYSDVRPFYGENFYRIRYKRNLEEGYSASITVFVQPQGISNIHVYPNPSPGKVTVEILKKVNDTGFIEISNLFGKVLRTIEFLEKTTRVELDLEDLNTGLYLIKVKQKGLRELTKRIVITR